MRVVCVPSALLVRRGCVNPAGGRAAPVASKLSRYSDASGTSTNQSVSMTASTRRYSGCQKQKPPQHRCGGFVVVDVGGERGTYLRKIVLDFSSLVIDSRRSWESGTGRLGLGERGGGADAATRSAQVRRPSSVGPLLEGNTGTGPNAASRSPRVTWLRPWNLKAGRLPFAMWRFRVARLIRWSSAASLRVSMSRLLSLVLSGVTVSVVSTSVILSILCLSGARLPHISE